MKTDRIQLTEEEKTKAIQDGQAKFARRRASGSVHRWNRKPSDHTCTAPACPLWNFRPFQKV